jgi:hypothetical protein
MRLHDNVWYSIMVRSGCAMAGRRDQGDMSVIAPPIVDLLIVTCNCWGEYFYFSIADKEVGKRSSSSKGKIISG